MKIKNTLTTTLLALGTHSALMGAVFTSNFSTSEGFTTGDADFTLGTATFSSPGEVVFFANGPYYFQSNRAWGVEGANSGNVSFGDISGGINSAGHLGDTFNHAQEITLWVRGSQAGDTNNVESTVFADANVAVHWYDENNALVHTDTNISNSSYQKITWSPDDFGASSFSRIRLQNLNGGNSFGLLGKVTFETQVSAVPEPGTYALISSVLVGGIAILRKRGRFSLKSSSEK